jgi:phosphatidylglycerophosphate synthase
MAQTRRKTKHRGNAAGVVESRGRTGRKPTAAEKKGDGKPVAAASKKPVDRRDQPPTWRGAFLKSMAASVVFLLLVLVLFKQSSAIAVFPVVVVGYTLVSYYTDKYVYERRQRKKAREGKASPR